MELTSLAGESLNILKTLPPNALDSLFDGNSVSRLSTQYSRQGSCANMPVKALPTCPAPNKTILNWLSTKLSNNKVV